jgi:hypothetical protein
MTDEARSSEPRPQETPASERLKVALAWAFVGIPAAWGVAQVVAKSAALFR